MRDPALSEQTAWFHQFAIASLPGHTPPNELSSEEFARAVVNLRENERKWNQALMSAIVLSNDSFKVNDTQSAVSILESFAKSCPWELFQDVARNQASNYRSRQ